MTPLDILYDELSEHEAPDAEAGEAVEQLFARSIFGSKHTYCCRMGHSGAPDRERQQFESYDWQAPFFCIRSARNKGWSVGSVRRGECPTRRAMAAESLTGREFFEELTSKKRKRVTRAATVGITGMVRKHAKGVRTALPLPRSPFLLFAPGTSCGDWLPVPLRLIDSVDRLGKTRCKNHQHDLVRIHLKAPTARDAKLFAHLLQRIQELPSPEEEAVGAEPAVPTMMEFGWPHIPTPHIPTPRIPMPHLPPIRIPPLRIPPLRLPDPRNAWRKKARQLALAAATRVDRERGSREYCPKEEIRAAILALGLPLLLSPDPASKFMAGVMGAIAVTLPDEYCRSRGK